MRICTFIALKALPALAGVALLAAWFVLVRPASLGGPASYVIVSGRSMEPTLRLNDLALVRRKDGYRVGDVIAFRVAEGEVIHRIVGGNAAQGFVTQGDNNPQPDLWRPRLPQIEGAMWAHVPAGGRAIEFLRQPVNAAIAVGSLATLVLLLRGTQTPAPRPKSEPQAAVPGAAAHGAGRNAPPPCPGASGRDRTPSGTPAAAPARGFAARGIPDRPRPPCIRPAERRPAERSLRRGG